MRLHEQFFFSRGSSPLEYARDAIARKNGAMKKKKKGKRGRKLVVCAPSAPLHT